MPPTPDPRPVPFNCASRGWIVAELAKVVAGCVLVDLERRPGGDPAALLDWYSTEAAAVTPAGVTRGERDQVRAKAAEAVAGALGNT